VASDARDLVLEHFGWNEGHADVWGLFRDAGTLATVVRALAEPFADAGVTAVCGVESRGFLLGAAVAVELGVGFVAVRKGDGLFPGDKVEREAGPDYRRQRHRLRVQRGSLGTNDQVLLVDDWIETGSQAAAVKDMVLVCGAAWAGCSVVIDQLTEDRAHAVGPVRALLRAEELPAPDAAPRARPSRGAVGHR
jgi:adenine phosphoribosyltransferase